jgi:hypothetical protein
MPGTLRASHPRLSVPRVLKPPGASDSPVTACPNGACTCVRTGRRVWCGSPRVRPATPVHDLMRTTGSDTSARLRELAGTCDSPLMAARARHATAARARNAAELASAAGDFEALGSTS